MLMLVRPVVQETTQQRSVSSHHKICKKEHSQPKMFSLFVCSENFKNLIVYFTLEALQTYADKVSAYSTHISLRYCEITSKSTCIDLAVCSYTWHTYCKETV